MEFTHDDVKSVNMPFWLDPRSIIVLKDEARYKWMHSIPPRKSDISPFGDKIKRGTRVSLTFRKVIL